MGVPLNFSGLSAAANQAYDRTGDFVLGRNLAILGELLDKGVKVALMYGDADYQCNCLLISTLLSHQETSTDFNDRVWR